jgi:hypothetical protein
VAEYCLAVPRDFRLARKGPAIDADGRRADAIFGNDRADICAVPSSMYAEHLTATGNHAVLLKISACWPIAPTGLQGVSNAEALMAAG